MRRLALLSVCLLLSSGCRGSGVPWRRVDATLTKGSRVEISVKAAFTGLVEASVRVESSEEGSATLSFDRSNGQ